VTARSTPPPSPPLARDGREQHPLESDKSIKGNHLLFTPPTNYERAALQKFIAAESNPFVDDGTADFSPHPLFQELGDLGFLEPHKPR